MSKTGSRLLGAAILAIAWFLIGYGVGAGLGAGHYREKYRTAVAYALELEEELASLSQASRATVGDVANDRADLRLEISELHLQLRFAREEIARLRSGRPDPR